MKKYFLPLVVVFSFAGCAGQKDSSDFPVEKTSGVVAENMDTSVKPGDDFNRYVNGKWMDTAVIPAERPSTGNWLELLEQSEEDVKKIVDEASNGDYIVGSNQQKIGDLNASYLDMSTRNVLGLTPLEAEFAKINAVSSYENLATYLASANKIGVVGPFQLDQYVDFQDPSKYMIYIAQGGIGLPDREYYFNKDAKSVEIRAKYKSHIQKMLELSGLANASASASTIMSLETRMAGSHWTKEEGRDMVKIYNPMSVPELKKLSPEFPWDAYLSEAGVADLEEIVVLMPSYIDEMGSIFKATSLEDWKTYLRWAVINSHAGILTEDLDNQNFEFFGKVLSGTEEQLPMWRRGVSMVNNHLGEAIGEVYVSKHFPEYAKERMLELIGNLVKAYEISIKDLDWMSDETKVQALDKLSKFTPKIGYPDEWEDYSGIDIAAGDLVGNVHRSQLDGYGKKLERQKEAVDRAEWAMTPQTVNAYYNPPLNEIVFPAAILQPPFFDISVEDAVNYGAIGAVIGHEIGHGFDDQGSTFDGDGTLRNWWTDEDHTEFKKRTSRLVEQYSEFKVFDDLNVNGEFTLGENIGDLGGVSIALLAYKLSLNGEEPPVIDGFTGYQRFFISWAQAWRGIARDEALRTQVATDPHSPARFRVNGVVRNVPEFYDAFGVSPSDSLYLAPDQRVKIW
ncbi:peptidase M13 [bacterium]|nr:peptidase M13 [bacterium]